jgi:Ca-activated chloride channel family protein
VKRWWVQFLRGLGLVLAMWAVVAAFAIVPVWLRAAEWLTVKWTAWPWLIVAGVLPPIILLAMTLGADARVPRLRVPTIAPIALGPRGTRTYFRDVPGVLRGAAMCFAFVALARPQNTLRDEQSGERGIDIVIVLDLSGSMRAIMDAPAQGPAEQHGKRPTRLDTAKDVILDFVGRRKTDRIGVVVFGRAAYVLAPPTLDYQLLTTLVGKMELDLIDGNGTAIGDAVGVGVARLRRSTSKSKAIVLLTDGDSNAGELSPEYATHLAKTQGVKVYTVQIGNGDDVDVQQGIDLFGQPKYVRQRFPVNPELLKTMASDTGGESFVATDKKGLESSMHSILDSLEKTKFLAQTSATEDLFPLLLTPAVLLLFLEALSRLFVIRRFP